VVGVSGLAAAEAALEVCGRRSDVVVTGGVHPHDAAEHADAVWELEGLFSDERVVALGEVGLDFHYDYSPREVQRRVFCESVALARHVRRPLVIHSRAAPDETIEILEREGAREVGGVIHCFSEDRAFAQRALDLGFDLSFSGIVTFKNARPVHEVAAWAPNDRILVETDSPYLAPLPLRGKRCEPAYVVHTAQRVAELRGLSLEELAALTTENACRRFGPRLAQAAGLG
jgi:TatD DNase family protein